MRVKIRQAEKNHISILEALEKKAWGKNGATREIIESRIRCFPEGTQVAFLNNKIVGVVFTQIIQYEPNKLAEKNWYEYTDRGFIKRSHQYSGNTLFGVDLSVDPEYTNNKIGTKLLLSVARLAIKRNLKYGLLGGRIPYYHKYKDVLVEDYLEMKNADGKDLDPELRLYKKVGLKVVGVVKDYFKDEESLNYGVILLWQNPFYKISRLFPFLGPLLAKIFRI